MRTNLRNQVRQTPLPKWKPLIPLFEAVMNSIQSIRDGKTTVGPGVIRVDVHRETTLLAPNESPMKGFTITDNGNGLDDDNFDSFNTSYSDFKQSVGGKGLGRFTWLKAFKHAEVESVFESHTEGTLRRKFVFSEGYEPDHAEVTPESDGVPGTVVRLVDMKEPYRSQVSPNIDQLVHRMVEHFLLIFLQPGCPRISIHDQGKAHSANELFDKEFKVAFAPHDFAIRGHKFTLHGFRLTAPRQSHHKLVYAANQRGVVSDQLREYMPNLGARLNDSEGRGFVYLGIIQSAYLSDHVNPARTDFDIGFDDSDADNISLFDEEIVHRAEIRDAALNYVHQDLQDILDDINSQKEQRIREYVRTDAPQYRILLKHLPAFIDKVSPGASKPELEASLHRELHQREVAMRREGAKIIKEARKLDDYEGYQSKLSSFMESYNELGAAALAQYVAHRKIILDFLQEAIEAPADSKRYPLEKVVHQLVFPMRSTSEDTAYAEQNLWMIDERLTFHSFISSDKPLSSISDELQSDSASRPDLLIFDKKVLFAEGEQPINSIVTIEFKRPGRDDYSASDNPITQSFDLIQNVRGGTFKVKGRPISVSNKSIPASAYCICDITPSLQKVLDDLDALTTPDGQGYYGFHKKYGIFYEVIDYNKLLHDARKRNRIFFEKLNLIDS